LFFAIPGIFIEQYQDLLRQVGAISDSNGRLPKCAA